LVTAWLIFLIIASLMSVGLTAYLMTYQTSTQQMLIPRNVVITMVVLQFVKVVSAVLLLNWMKLGYWIYVAACLGMAYLYYSNASFGFGGTRAIFALVGIVIMTMVLKIPRDEIPAWKHLR